MLWSSAVSFSIWILLEHESPRSLEKIRRCIRGPGVVKCRRDEMSHRYLDFFHAVLDSVLSLSWVELYVPDRGGLRHEIAALVVASGSHG